MADTTKPKPVIANPEDDLDDLDELLDEFDDSAIPVPSAPPPTASTTTADGGFAAAAAAATSGRPRTNTRVDAQPASVPGRGPPLDPTDELDESELSSEFAKELARGMESLMREISGGAADPSSSTSTTASTASGARAGSSGDASSATAAASLDALEDDETTKALKAAWEAMLIEGMNGGKAGHDDVLPKLGATLPDHPGASSGSGGSGSAATDTNNFQERIRQAMDQMKDSEDTLRGAGGAGSGAGAAAGGPSSSELEELLKTLGGLGGEGGDGDNDTELAGFLESMMSQLMSKEILHEPLKELAESFPPYLANPPQPLSAEDRTRYEKQLVCVRKIVEVFERPSFNDTDAESNALIVELMAEMQTHGSPPTELMGPLPAGFDGTLPGLSPNGSEPCSIM